MKNQSGFSLVEVLISLVLMSMMVVSVIQMTNSAGEVKEKVLIEDEEKLSIEIAMARMNKDLNLFFTNKYFSTPINPSRTSQNITDEDALNWIQQKNQQTSERFPEFSQNYQPIPTLQFDEDSIEFMTIGNIRRYQNQKTSRFNWVRYSIENDQDSEFKQLKRYVYSINPFNQNNFDFEGIKGQVLLSNLTEFEFFFWNKDKEKFIDDFTPTNPDQSPLQGLRIQFKWRDSLKREFEYSRVFRTLWPIYEIEMEEEISQLQNALQPLNGSNNSSNGGGTP